MRKDTTTPKSKYTRISSALSGEDTSARIGKKLSKKYIKYVKPYTYPGIIHKSS